MASSSSCRSLSVKGDASCLICLSRKYGEVLLNLGHTPEILIYIKSLATSTVAGRSRALCGHGIRVREKALASSYIPGSESVQQERETFHTLDY